MAPSIKHLGPKARIIGLLTSAALIATAPAHGQSAAQSPESEDDAAALTRLQQLQAQLEEQKRRLREQQQVIEAQEREIKKLILEITPESEGDDHQAQKSATDNGSAPEPAQETPRSVGRQEEAEKASKAQQTQVPIFSDVAGVLTPKGQLILEPRVDFTQSGVNRVFFQGVELIDVLLVGIFELTDADRQTYSSSLTARYGITNRFEIDAEVPFVHRDDRLMSQAVNVEGENMLQELTGTGLGDPEVGLHYQLNRGRGGWPVFVANFRAKSDFGEGPFEIDRNAEGVEQELPVGSGFWTLEPSVTILSTLDPAVLFINAGYLFNMSKELDVQIGDALITRVDPGDTVRAGFGLGVGLNDSLSFSLGYEHNYVRGTETVVDGIPQKSTALQVGSLLFGVSVGLTDRLRLNINTQIGVTEDTPDVRVGLSLPFRF